MGGRQIIVLWLLTGLMTLIACVVAAATGNQALSAVAALIFAVTSIISSWLLNQRRVTTAGGVSQVLAARENALMVAGAFGWSGATILGSYYLTSLFWHHAWQYGGAMVLIAIGLLLYERVLRQPVSRLRSRNMLKAAGILAAVQACAAAAGLAFLISSGKLSANKADWLANHIFLAGGLTLALLSIFSARVQWRA